MFDVREKPKMVQRALLVGAYFKRDGEAEAKSLLDELRELGNRFGVAITSFGIAMDQLDEWPDALGIERMGNKEFDHLQGAITMHKITTGQPNPGLNWRVIDKLKQDNRDFSELFSWITSSLETGRAFPYELHRTPATTSATRNVVSF